MNATDINSEFQNQQVSPQGSAIDIKRVLYHAVRFWYLVALSLCIALAVAFFKTRYQARVYPVTASILIKETEETSEGKLLYNNPLVSGFRNYLNEIYLLRSYPLVERTLEELNFGVSFYKEGNVLTTEAYNLPFNGQILHHGRQKSFRLSFKVIDDRQYQVAKYSESIDDIAWTKFRFNDTVAFNGINLVVRRNSFPWDKTVEGIPLIFNYSDPANLTGSYVGRLEVSWAEEGSGVMNLNINGTNPAKEIDFLNGLISQYQLYDLEKKNQAASRTIDFISDQLVGISDSLRQVEHQLETFKDKNVLTDLSAEAERLYSKLQDIEGGRAELMIRQNYYEYLSDYLKQSTNLDQIILPTSVGINDPILSSLVSKMVELQMQLKMNSHAENPLVGEVKRKIDQIRRDVIESVRNQQSTDKIRQNYVDRQIKDIERQLNGLPLAERQLVSIQRNYSLLENLYVFLLQKRAEAGISKAATTTDIAVVNPPMLAGGPISPQPIRNYMFAFFIGLGLPVLIFVLLEFLNTKVQSKEDVEKVTTIPFIGGVGHKKSENNLEVLTKPKTAIAESFRALRSNLNYFLGKQEKAVILVTSSISGEGKTFTSINLASVIHLSGKRTLIIGADLRRPRIFSDFNLNNDIGLSSYLAGIADFNSVIQKTQYEGLDLVTGGTVPPNPSELLLTEKIEMFIAEAKSKYDYIIIDTPPLGIVTDAFVLSRVADHTLFLVRQNHTPKELLKTVEDFYKSGRLKNISLVLNDIYRTGPGYGYGYNYGYGYGYSNGLGKKSASNGYGYYSES